MIQIICKNESYVYNVYHMVKAFYPSADVTSAVDEKASNYVTVRVPGEADICIAEK